MLITNAKVFMGTEFRTGVMVRIADGKIAEEGTHESLLKLNGNF